MGIPLCICTQSRSKMTFATLLECDSEKQYHILAQSNLAAFGMAKVHYICKQTQYQLGPGFLHPYFPNHQPQYHINGLQHQFPPQPQAPKQRAIQYLGRYSEKEFDFIGYSRNDQRLRWLEIGTTFREEFGYFENYRLLSAYYRQVWGTENLIYLHPERVVNYTWVSLEGKAEARKLIVERYVELLT